MCSNWARSCAACNSTAFLSVISMLMPTNRTCSLRETVSTFPRDMIQRTDPPGSTMRYSAPVSVPNCSASLTVSRSRSRSSGCTIARTLTESMPPSGESPNISCALSVAQICPLPDSQCHRQVFEAVAAKLKYASLSRKASFTRFCFRRSNSSQAIKKACASNMTKRMIISVRCISHSAKSLAGSLRA